MLRFSRAKVVATLAAILVGLALAVPSFFSPEQRQGFQASLPSWLPAWIVPTRAIVLGLDLQGGSHVLLEVDSNDLLRSQGVQLRDDVRRVLREGTVTPDGGIQVVGRGVQLRVADAANRAKVFPKLQELSQPISNAIIGQTGARTLDVTQTPEGLIQLGFTDAGITDRVRRAVGQAIEVIRRRVDAPTASRSRCRASRTRRASRHCSARRRSSSSGCSASRARRMWTSFPRATTAASACRWSAG